MGGEIHAIGNGTVLMAQDFIEQFGIRFPVYTDPSRASYRAAGMHRRFGLGLASIGRAKRAMDAGHRQGKVLGDAWQQGGVLVVLPGGREIYRHVDEGAGDHQPVTEVVDALRGALSSGV